MHYFSAVVMELKAYSVTLLLLYFSDFLTGSLTSDYTAIPSIQQDSDGIPLAHMMAKHTFSKRTRQALLEVNSLAELNELVEKYPYVAILIQDESKACLKTLHDLELIKADAHLFQITWRRINATNFIENGDLGVLSSNCSVVFYKNAQPAKYPGKADRQTAVLKWLIKEIHCHTDEPLDVNVHQFEVLIRSFRNFILVLSSSRIKSSRQLVHQFRRYNNWCSKTNRILIASTDSSEIIKKLELPHRPPLILHIVHGLYIIFDGNIADMNSVLEWITIEVPTNLKVVGQSHLDRIFAREEVVLVFFIDESTPLLNAALKKAGRDLELTFGLAVVDVTDMEVAASFNITTFPSVALFEEGNLKMYQKDLIGEKNVKKSAERMRQWIIQRLEANDRIIVKTIASEDFKSSPDDFKHVLLKEHKDSIKKLSLEYVKLQRENVELRKIIAAAKEALGLIEIVTMSEIQADALDEAASENFGLTEECKDCLSSFGMAVWNCGTFEMDCIKGAIELGSECHPCICEIMDYWWPDDAPNCFQKEIQKITKPESEQSKPIEKVEL